MPPSKVLLRLPATSANLGPGFDCLGLALDLWSAATLQAHDVEVEQPEEPLLAWPSPPPAPSSRQAARSGPRGLSFDWRNGFPLARGLGASAAVRAAALLGANVLAGNPLSVEDLLAIGAALEDHADNITPALLGGLQVAVWEDGRVVHAPVPVPDGMKVVLMVPEQADADRREPPSLLPEVPREDAVHNVGHASLLVAALSSGGSTCWRPPATTVSTSRRAPSSCRRWAPSSTPPASAGALCSYLSGGGSTIAAWTLHNEKADREGDAAGGRVGELPRRDDNY